MTLVDDEQCPPSRLSTQRPSYKMLLMFQAFGSDVDPVSICTRWRRVMDVVHCVAKLVK